MGLELKLQLELEAQTKRDGAMLFASPTELGQPSRGAQPGSSWMQAMGRMSGEMQRSKGRMSSRAERTHRLRELLVDWLYHWRVQQTAPTNMLQLPDEEKRPAVWRTQAHGGGA